MFPGCLFITALCRPWPCPLCYGTVQQICPDDDDAFTKSTLDLE